MPEPVVDIQDLHYSYEDGTTALMGVDLIVERGEKVGIIGPNGAGKSTLLLHLNGVLRGKGTAKVVGLEINKNNLSDIRRKVGIVFQDPHNQLFCPTVFDDVAFGPLNLGYQPEVVERMVREALRQVGLHESFVQRSAHHLSIGEMKRVGLATVLVMMPEVLVLDEPSSNLDPRSRRNLIEMLRTIDLSMIIATHDLELVSELCSRVLVLDQGRVWASGPAMEILSDERLLKDHGLEMPLSIKLQRK
jgi:cobalt/nickel transport system ATP-binding protein